MKVLSLFLLTIAILLTIDANAQVGIGTNTPDASAQLDITSASKGILIPRMTDIQRDNIPAPADGLLIYQTNVVPGFYIYDGAVWSLLLKSSNNLSDISNASDARINLGLAVGTDVQPYSAALQSIAGLTTTADMMIYTTGSDSYETTDLTSQARLFLSQSSAITQRDVLQLGYFDSPSFAAIAFGGAPMSFYGSDIAAAGVVNSTTDNSIIVAHTPGTGVYTITLPFNPPNAINSVTLQSLGLSTATRAGQVITVVTYDTTGTPTDLDFYLLIVTF